MAKDCPIFPDNPSHCDVIVAVKRTVASLSMVGSLFIIFIIWLFQKYKHFEQRLILALSIAAFMSCISYLMGDLHPEKGPACILQAWWLTYFNRCVILWVCCITFNLYWNFIKERKTKKFEKWYHVISWGISFAISLLPLIDDHYGPAGPWCWIPRESSNSTVWRFMMWYVPLFIIITILFIVYGYIIYTYRKKRNEWTGTYNAEQQRQIEWYAEKVKPLVAYPCIYLALSIFPLIHRIYNATTAVPSFPLLLLHVICNPLPGALNAIAYGLDKETLNKLNWQHMKVAFLHRFRQAPHIEEYQIEATVTVGNDLPHVKPAERSRHYENDVEIDIDKVRDDNNDVRDDNDNDDNDNDDNDNDNDDNDNDDDD